jgi:MoxR-like ATPase
MATQNPIESEGTYPLPEAQVDRFMLKILIDYPAHDEELTIVQRQLVEAPELRQALTLDDLKALQQEVAGIYVDPALVSYAVDLATATRQPGDDLKEYISFGASPRGPMTVVQRQLVAPPELRQVLSLEDLIALQRTVFDIYVDPALVSYAVTIANATREPAAHGMPEVTPYVAFGASPRGPISLVQASRALALVRGRDYVLAEDLQTLMKDAMRHRLVLTYQALAEEMSPDAILDRVLSEVPVPATDLARPNVA